MSEVADKHLETAVWVLEEVTNDYRWTHSEGREILQARDALGEALDSS